jgi:hypothetical protein
MPDYVAAAKGNLAWVAWREGDLPEADALGQAALERWQESALVYPFRWIGLWPLIAVALARDREDEALAHAKALLEPQQQRLPDELSGALEAAIRARAEDQAGLARSHLDRVMESAREMGYL